MNAGENSGRRDSVWNTLRPGRSSRVVAYAYRNPTTVAEPLHIVDRPLPVVVDELEGGQRGHPQGGRRVSPRWIPQSELGIDVLRQAPEHEIHETPRPLGIGPALDDRHAPDLRGGVRGE